MFSQSDTPARKVYHRDVRWLLLAYFAVLVSSALIVKHWSGQGLWRYFWAILPTVPIVGIIARMGKYLHEETDEYLRLLQMNSLLAGTGALLTALLICDFLRSFAHAPDFAPFVLFFCFAGGMGVMQIVQSVRNRAPRDE